jgi:tetratricopeptide (TPR) repeat protein
LDGKGTALEKLGKSDEAIQAFNKAIEVNPQDSYAWKQKGSLSK